MIAWILAQKEKILSHATNITLHEGVHPLVSSPWVSYNIIGKLLEQASDGNQVLAIKVVRFHLLWEHSEGLRRDYSRIEES
jgi:hypothetical protein